MSATAWTRNTANTSKAAAKKPAKDSIASPAVMAGHRPEIIVHAFSGLFSSVEQAPLAGAGHFNHV